MQDHVRGKPDKNIRDEFSRTVKCRHSTDYFKDETFSYYEMAKEIAKLHLLFKKPAKNRATK